MALCVTVFVSSPAIDQSLFSDHWYRVADIKPQLRGHIRLHRHTYRKQRWYVIEDPITAQYHRFAPTAYYLIQQMNGKRSLQTLWEDTLDHLGNEGPTQSEIVQLLAQLHSQDLLASNVLPNTVEQYLRGERARKMKTLQRFISPLAIRIPLVDPDRFLTRFQHLVRPLFSPAGVALWLLVHIYAIAIASTHFTALTSNVIDTIISPSNLLLIGLLFPVIKGLHELGHGFATKVWGGEIHEMGLMFLVFMPVPYVDASSASMFPRSFQRAMVGAAGMIVELFIAALALIVWSMVEQGAVKTIAYNVVLIAGVSTILFNANPLLRFDGYYILADILQIPNLAAKSNRFINHGAQRYLFGVKTLPPMPLTQGERGWLTFYGFASFLYRMVLMVAITLFVASKFFFIGILLASWTALLMFVNPLLKGGRFLLYSPTLSHKRVRALSISALILFTLYGAIFYYEAPHARVAQGLVWLPDDAYLRSQEECYLTELVRHAGESIKKGDLIARCSSVEVNFQLDIINARLTEMKTRYLQQIREDRTQAQITQEMINTLLSQLSHTQNKLDALNIVSLTDGTLTMPNEQDLVGSYLSKGDLLAYVIQDSSPRIRAIVEQSDLELVRNQRVGIDMKLPHQADKTYALQLDRETPAGSTQLPSSALGNQGGGDIVVDPRMAGGQQSFAPLFHFELSLQAPVGAQASPIVPEALVNWYGQRVLLKFHLQPEPIAQQWYRRIRQLFMAQFGV